MKTVVSQNIHILIVPATVLAVLVVSTSVIIADEIHDAAARGDVAAIERLLAANGSVLNSQGQAISEAEDLTVTGTALHVAVMFQHKDVVKLLLEKGADVKARSRVGNTPLHCAAWRCNKDITEILLAAKGVDVNAVNDAGKTPLQMAVEGFPRGERPSAAQRAAVVEMLLKKGANPNLADNNGDTPLQLAMAEDDAELKTVFERHGFKIAAPPAAPAGAFVVPFQLKPVILVKGKINDQTVTFGFDTGASHTVLSTEAARAAGVTGSTANIGAGDAILTNHRVVVMDLPQFQQFRILGVNVAGILGYSYISQFVTTFDYRKRVLILVPKNAAPPMTEEKGSTVVPFTLNPMANLIFIKARVNDFEPLTFLFDSGSEGTFLTPATAEKLGIKGTGAEQTNIGMVERATVDSISVANAEAKKVPVMIADPPQAQMLKMIGQKYDGILGRSFFSRFLITLDYRTKQLKLTPNQ